MFVPSSDGNSLAPCSCHYSTLCHSASCTNRERAGRTLEEAREVHQRPVFFVVGVLLRVHVGNALDGLDNIVLSDLHYKTLRVKVPRSTTGWPRTVRWEPELDLL